MLERSLSIGDMMVGVPGAMVQERANPSQDPRLTIRGFGARSAFGVRGVRVMRDGVPLSLPDGQTPIDWLELESVGSIEVVRGTAAALGDTVHVARHGMPGFDSMLSPREIHAVITYLKAGWTPAQRRRQAEASRADPFPEPFESR